MGREEKGKEAKEAKGQGRFVSSPLGEGATIYDVIRYVCAAYHSCLTRTQAIWNGLGDADFGGLDKPRVPASPWTCANSELRPQAASISLPNAIWLAITTEGRRSLVTGIKRERDDSVTQFITVSPRVDRVEARWAISTFYSIMYS